MVHAFDIGFPCSYGSSAGARKREATTGFANCGLPDGLLYRQRSRTLPQSRGLYRNVRVCPDEGPRCILNRNQVVGEALAGDTPLVGRADLRHTTGIDMRHTDGHRDNWGWRARIGMFIVGNEAVPEAEWWAMLPPDTSVHAARVTAKAPWATWNAAHSDVELAEDLARGARQFAAMRLEAVVLGHSSSSIAGGKGWDEAVINQLAAMLPEGVAVTTNGYDCLAALRALDITRPLLVFPPWFGDESLTAGVGYFRDNGFEPVHHIRHDPGRGWRELPPSELYANGAGFAQDVEALYTNIRRACPAGADGVLIAGTGFRCSRIIETLEEDLGIPVVAANQASLWHCLRLSGVRTSIDGYGRLLRLD